MTDTQGTKWVHDNYNISGFIAEAAKVSFIFAAVFYKCKKGFLKSKTRLCTELQS
jgi:hypothetical protein